MAKLPRCIICGEKPATTSHFFGEKKEIVCKEGKERAIFISRMLGTYDEVERFKRWYEKYRGVGIAQNL